MAKKKPQISEMDINARAAQMKRSLTFIILAVMIMSLTMCNAPGRDLLYGDVYQTLVNRTHRLPDGWLDIVELVPAKNSLGEESLVEKETLAHFEELRSELLEEGIDIEIDSAYRSVDDQRVLYEEFKERYGDEVDNIAAKPGYSEHHTGLVIDVFLIDNGKEIRDNDDLYAAEELFAKIHPHLADHGFILRYPKGKEDITGYDYEPWHFRYVEIETAKKITEQGATLEEYLGETK